jgi:hypothetical protein
VAIAHRLERVALTVSTAAVVGDVAMALRVPRQDNRMAAALEATAVVVDTNIAPKVQSAKRIMCDTQSKVFVHARYGLCTLQNYIYSAPSFT